MSSPRAPIGTVTRGTTNPNRLRRCDRWLVATRRRVLRGAEDPLVVDLGYGSSPVTARELRDRLRRVRPDVRVVGVEIDGDRVDEGMRMADPPSLTFRRGGFEMGLARDERPVVVRAFNVLRQYDEAEVAGAWAEVTSHLAPGGLLVDGTCDEIGRVAAWVTVTDEGPRSLTISVRTGSLTRPSVVAERLPKVLIHRNVPGEPVHALLRDLDAAWERAAPHSAFGSRARFVAAVTALADSGRWPVEPAPRRWRLGELTVDWSAVAPQR
ncbi:class I SAM-dependent methyltransferase [Nostocoides sp. F2B08]|uniref:class I SAM-dependent methyltransferase n=1 Tax=Nostocoides sp. F2B08 TaxID=2653936 RepID=UPI001262ED68|nr:class I SAM-dependent methyltransferase [Tetrasphaera sp. F2B08]KAB7745084.1 class I SAM-dependent methyltransferase [Tetrasphaera sp. F2B08]